MTKESTEALARSQLEILYELGILERSSDDDEPSRSSKSDRDGRHDAFLAALPPPSVIFPLHSRMTQSSVDDSNSSQHSGNKFNGGNGSEISSHLLKLSRQRQSYKPRMRISQRSSNSSASSSSSQSVKQNRRALRTWFRQWKIFTRHRRRKARRAATADTFLMQNTMTKWAYFLKQRRYEHEKKQIIDSWKVSRAISRWAQWKHRSCAVRRLLNMGRSSFMGRLIQKRVWRRWIQFTIRRKYVNGVLTQRTRCLHQRIMHSAWTELRIYAFRARQDSLAMLRCMKAMRNLCAIQERQRLTCEQYQLEVNLARKRELLQRWRAKSEQKFFMGSSTASDLLKDGRPTTRCD
ncbi:hypothetical protein L915_10989 [Phytophthora nicotianae]|uniref:Sfi1 spindle body domain-containing protein n=1 Tax=Phytophthora nicotianae TaxID=4792 RepID=W2GM71_PHYNI|nr:hypothetical protein L915_10989 [Phytophthora nicotianae]